MSHSSKMGNLIRRSSKNELPSPEQSDSDEEQLNIYSASCKYSAVYCALACNAMPSFAAEVDAFARCKSQMPLFYEACERSVGAEGQIWSWPKRREQRIPNVRNFYHLTLLQIAVCNQDIHLIPHLVRNGEDVNARAVGGLTALHLAAADLNKETVGALLDCGANVNLTILQTQKSALHIAVRRSSLKCSIVLKAGQDCVELLLRRGANLHLRDSDGQEAIHLACQGGRKDLVSLLLNYGANVNSLTEQGESPLFLLLEKRLSPKKKELVDTVLDLTYPLRLTNHRGNLPLVLRLCGNQELRQRVVKLSKVWPLQEICKCHLRNMYRGNAKFQLKGKIPTNLWNSTFASNLKGSDHSAPTGTVTLSG